MKLCLQLGIRTFRLEYNSRRAASLSPARTHTLQPHVNTSSAERAQWHGVHTWSGKIVYANKVPGAAASLFQFKVKSIAWTEHPNISPRPWTDENWLFKLSTQTMEHWKVIPAHVSIEKQMVFYFALSSICSLWFGVEYPAAAATAFNSTLIGNVCNAKKPIRTNPFDGAKLFINLLNSKRAPVVAVAQWHESSSMYRFCVCRNISASMIRIITLFVIRRCGLRRGSTKHNRLFAMAIATHWIHWDFHYFINCGSGIRR